MIVSNLNMVEIMISSKKLSVINIIFRLPNFNKKNVKQIKLNFSRKKLLNMKNRICSGNIYKIDIQKPKTKYDSYKHRQLLEFYYFRIFTR